MRYLFLLLLLCSITGIRTLDAQCDFQIGGQAGDVVCFGQNNGAIDLTISNGTGPFNYIWSNSETTEDISSLPAGAYTVTVTDALGCTATANFTINQPAQLTVTATGNNVLTCFLTSTELVAQASGGVVPYAYLWANGVTTAANFLSAPGSYGLTVTDANGCTATSSVLVFEDTAVPVACINPAQVLTCATPSLVLDGTCTSDGPTFTFLWSSPNGNIISGQNTLTPTVNAPGIYTLLVTDLTNGCTSVAQVAVQADILAPLASAGPDLNIPCTGGVVTLVGSGTPGAQFLYLWTTPDGQIISGQNTLNPLVDEPGIYTLLVTNPVNGCTATDVMEVLPSTNGLCARIQGRVLEDTLQNCVTDSGEPGLGGWIVRADGALGDYYAVTDADGNYEINVVAGDTYEVSAIAGSVLWEACAAPGSFVVTIPDETVVAPDILFKKLAGCPLLSVDISSGNLRRCFDNNFFFVSYCNLGTETAEDAFVVITLDPFLSMVSSSIAYTDLGNGQIRFELGDVDVNYCGSFNFRALLSCDAALGQSHCTEAHIYPDTLCLAPNAQWSGASLRISSECDTDSVRFRIENVGIGNMPNAVEYIVIEDQVMLMSAPVQLAAGEFVLVNVPANGSTWRLEVEQEPFHPGASAPAVSVEGCTTGPTFSTGFVNQFPTDDADEFIDIHCLQNTGSFDPNDKQGFPAGYGEEHYIRPGTPLEYLIRFQNTGNDTAFTVRLVDTLSAWLDPATLRPGASSHVYSWDLSGAGVLTFLYENILLPDSNVNEPASHGFVKFTIQHRADAPLETVIENSAAIYFDFNDPIITNTTFHRLGENFLTVGLWQPERALYQVQVTPNPFFDEALLEVKGLEKNAPLRLQVFDLQGLLQLEMVTESTVFALEKDRLATGMYLFRVEQNGNMIGNGKFVVQR